jgi:tetrahydromethanopterin S-methyltransferase subunit F
VDEDYSAFTGLIVFSMGQGAVFFDDASVNDIRDADRFVGRKSRLAIEGRHCSELLQVIACSC